LENTCQDEMRKPGHTSRAAVGTANLPFWIDAGSANRGANTVGKLARSSRDVAMEWCVDEPGVVHGSRIPGRRLWSFLSVVYILRRQAATGGPSDRPRRGGRRLSPSHDSTRIWISRRLDLQIASPHGGGQEMQIGKQGGIQEASKEPSWSSYHLKPSSTWHQEGRPLKFTTR
jgi:hypothetical protein